MTKKELSNRWKPFNIDEDGCQKTKASLDLLRIILRHSIPPSQLHFIESFTATQRCSSEQCASCTYLVRNTALILVANVKCEVAKTTKGILSKMISGKMNLPPARCQSIVAHAVRCIHEGCLDCETILKRLAYLTDIELDLEPKNRPLISAKEPLSISEIKRSFLELDYPLVRSWRRENWVEPKEDIL